MDIIRTEVSEKHDTQSQFINIQMMRTEETPHKRHSSLPYLNLKNSVAFKSNNSFKNTSSVKNNDTLSTFSSQKSQNFYKRIYTIFKRKPDVKNNYIMKKYQNMQYLDSNQKMDVFTKMDTLDTERDQFLTSENNFGLQSSIQWQQWQAGDEIQDYDHKNEKYLQGLSLFQKRVKQYIESIGLKKLGQKEVFKLYGQVNISHQSSTSQSPKKKKKNFWKSLDYLGQQISSQLVENVSQYQYIQDLNHKKELGCAPQRKRRINKNDEQSQEIQFQNFLIHKLGPFFSNEKISLDQKMKFAEEQYQQFLRDIETKSFSLKIPDIMGRRTKNINYNEYYELGDLESIQKRIQQYSRINRDDLSEYNPYSLFKPILETEHSLRQHTENSEQITPVQENDLEVESRKSTPVCEKDDENEFQYDSQKKSTKRKPGSQKSSQQSKQRSQKTKNSNKRQQQENQQTENQLVQQINQESSDSDPGFSNKNQPSRNQDRKEFFEIQDMVPKYEQYRGGNDHFIQNPKPNLKQKIIRTDQPAQQQSNSIPITKPINKDGIDNYEEQKKNDYREPQQSNKSNASKKRQLNTGQVQQMKVTHKDRFDLEAEQEAKKAMQEIDLNTNSQINNNKLEQDVNSNNNNYQNDEKEQNQDYSQKIKKQTKILQNQKKPPQRKLIKVKDTQMKDQDNNIQHQNGNENAQTQQQEDQPNQEQNNIAKTQNQDEKDENQGDKNKQDSKKLQNTLQIETSTKLNKNRKSKNLLKITKSPKEGQKKSFTQARISHLDNDDYQEAVMKRNGTQKRVISSNILDELCKLEDIDDYNLENFQQQSAVIDIGSQGIIDKIKFKNSDQKLKFETLLRWQLGLDFFIEQMQNRFKEPEVSDSESEIAGEDDEDEVSDNEMDTLVE